MGFGYEVKGYDDRKVKAAKNLVDLAGAATFPGALLVNDLPFRKCSPISHRLLIRLIRASTTHPRMASMVELQADCSPWL